MRSLEVLKLVLGLEIWKDLWRIMKQKHCLNLAKVISQWVMAQYYLYILNLGFPKWEIEGLYGFFLIYRAVSEYTHTGRTTQTCLKRRGKSSVFASKGSKGWRKEDAVSKAKQRRLFLSAFFLSVVDVSGWYLLSDYFVLGS